MFLLCLTLLPGVPNKNCYSGQAAWQGSFVLQLPSKGTVVDEGKGNHLLS